MGIVIIHGWSDEGASFKNLASHLSESLSIPITIINIADWISLQDKVTYSDIATGMQRAWVSLNLSVEPRSVDIVVHSTGSLIVREWMTRFYTSATVPIHRFLMLAPANFGSPLAHKGRSFIGRAIKGWHKFFGQTGAEILKGLELGSPYTIALAEKDLFSNQTWYGAGKILATVLVGNAGYDGVEAIANEIGGDGTVRISTANLNCKFLSIPLNSSQQATNARLKVSKGEIAFGIVDNENHSTIALKGSRSNPSNNPLTPALITRALTVTDADFKVTNNVFPWQVEVEGVARSSEISSPRFMNLVTHLKDDLGNEVQDYFLQLYRKTNSDRRFEKEVYEDVFKTVHAYEGNPAYRSLYISIDSLDKIISKYTVDSITISASAQPAFNPPNNPVGYSSVSAASLDGLQIPSAQISKYFMPHQTLIAEIIMERQVDRSVFGIR